MAFKEIAPKEIQGNLMRMIADEWMLVAAGGPDKCNMMTASWGFAGEMWGKECAVAMIRPQRYTFEFLEREDFFTLSFYGGRKDIHKICGSQSGRDIDKVAAAGLTPVFAEGTVYFAEARLVLVCKKLYAQDLKEENFLDKDCLKWYPDKDYHRMYVGEIVKVLEKTQEA
ncbi:MAG: flavin reductase family protein [Clostridiales bacterium]|nr:flavin reductase family protein [Clostridiales bacterium]